MFSKKPINELPTPMNAMEHYLSQILIRLDELCEVNNNVIPTAVPEKTITKGGEKINEPKPISIKSKK